MKLKALVLALFVAGLCASFALADNGSAGSTTSTSTTTTSTSAGEHHGGKKDAGACHAFTVELKGSLVSVGSASFVMDVKRANHHGHDLAGKQATIAVDDKTRMERHGAAQLADLKVGDRLSVQARACRAQDASAPAAPAQLVARKVNASPAKAADAKDDGEHSTTTTTTTSTK